MEAPEDEFVEVKPEAKMTVEPESELPDWLTEMTEPESIADEDETEQEIAAEPASELPDWLQELEGAEQPILGDTQPTYIDAQNTDTLLDQETISEIINEQETQIDIPDITR